jgi:hypothetical protein
MSDTYSAIIFSADEGREVFQRAGAHARAMVDNGERVLVVVGPALEPIGIQQRKFLHGPVLGQIAERARVAGERYVIDVWKEYYRKKFLGTNGARYEMQKLPGQKRATPRRIVISTESLGIRAYAEFTNKVIDDATLELGVEFVFTNEDQALMRRRPASKGEHGSDD